MNTIPFQTIDWTSVEQIETKGISGTAFAQTIEFASLRLRIVEYSKNYCADHWCQKGHIVHCLEGEFVTEFKNAEAVKLTQGMSFSVSDNQSSHRSVSESGAKLLVIDGDFLS